jgi:hypothetical protein
MSKRESSFLAGIVFSMLGLAGVLLFRPKEFVYYESVNDILSVLQSVSAIFFVFAAHFFWTAYKHKDRRPKARTDQRSQL